jgi:phospholipase/lecithinase/hemolysin
VIFNTGLCTVVVGYVGAGAVDAAEAIYVFGDSYVDTGNNPVTVKPYGSDWTGQPPGRWSDGRVLTDYFGKTF